MNNRTGFLPILQDYNSAEKSTYRFALKIMQILIFVYLHWVQMTRSFL